MDFTVFFLLLELAVIPFPSLGALDRGVNKAYSLKILALIPFTGSEPRDGKTCMAGAQVAVDNVNSRKDILPKYSISVEYRDEGPASNFAPRQYVDFIRNFKQNGTQYMAPVVIGNDKNCQNNARIIEKNYMVQFATSCLGPLVTGDRVNFPNLYKNHIPTDSFLIPQLLFTMEVGKWKQIAIISNAGNSNDYIRSKLLYSKAVGLGIDVVWFGSVVDMDNTIALDLKSSDSRVIIVQFSDIPMCVKFLCFTYMNDINNWQYVFLMAATSYFDPRSNATKLPTGCSRQMVIDQMRITFWVGAIDWAIENNGVTDLGYDLVGFEKLLDEATNKTRTPDYERRHRCHDTMEQALLSLDKADKILGRSYNFSLKDFQTEPELVMQIVNQTAASTDFVGLRIGRIFYSDRLEVDSELQYVSQWFDGDLKLLYKTKFLGRNASALYDTASYEFFKIAEPLWLTKTKRPPPDLARIALTLNIVEQGLTTSVIVLSVMFSIVHLVYLAALIIVRKQNYGFYSQRFSNLILLTGCLFINFMAISFVVDPRWSPRTVCFIKVVAPCFGLSLMVGILFARITYLARRISFIARSKATVRENKAEWRRKLRRFMGQLSNQTFGQMEKKQKFQLPEVDNSQRDKVSALVALGLCFFNIVVGCIIAFVKDSVLIIGKNPALTVSLTPVTFDFDNGFYMQTETVHCKLEQSITVIAILISCNFLPLLFGLFLSYELRKSTAIDHSLQYELMATKLGVINAFTLFLMIIAIAFFVPTNAVMLRSGILAIGALLISNTTSGLTFIRAINNYKAISQAPSDSAMPDPALMLTVNTERGGKTMITRGRGDSFSMRMMPFQSPKPNV